MNILLSFITLLRLCVFLKPRYYWDVFLKSNFNYGNGKTTCG